MSVKYGLTIENQNLIIEKAAIKDDGCYSFRGVTYRTVNGKAVLFAWRGEIIQPFGNFNTVIGSYNPEQVCPRKMLKKVRL